MNKVLILFVVFFLIASCKPTRFVPEEKYLLNKNTITCDNGNINSDELESYVKQKPNRKVLMLFRFHLGIYNILNSGKERKWKNKIKEIVGEEPVIYDEYLKFKTTKQLSLYLKNKGYYASSVKDEVEFKKKKANVHYIIKTGEPYKVNNVTYQIEDESIASVILLDSINSVIKKGIVFDVDKLQEERVRITNFLKDIGYYYFTKEYIYIDADSSIGNNKINATIGVKKFQKKIGEKEFITENHSAYKINKIYVYVDYDPKAALAQGNEYLANADTVFYQGISFIYTKRLTIKPNIITQSNYIIPENWFRQRDVEKTYKALSSLKIYKLVNIVFTDLSDSLKRKRLDCHIQLTPFTMQSYTVELEGTNSSGNLGVAGNLLYQHKSLFKGAEVFDLKMKGALEAQTTTSKSNDGIIQENIPFNTFEFGSEARIQFPKFLLPLRSDKFVKKYNPKTAFSESYNYQQRPDYTRTIFNNTFGYFWDGNKFLKHIFNPVEVNLVKIKLNSIDFINSIKDPNLLASYHDHMVTVTSYSLIFNTQDIKKMRDFMYVRWNLESSGNLLSVYNSLLNSQKTDGSYLIFGTKYSQYLKSDVDFRYYKIINKGNNIVYRIFAGAGYPFGNLNVMPFEKKYFSGGANSIRAWQVRSLGPGSYNDTLNVPNQLGDIKLEANLEYRFKVFWVLEGALFLDAGNIWAINSFDSREGAQFRLNEFYKQIALGTGVGFRFDFSFFIFRFDIGMKLRDPELPEGNRWIPGSRPIGQNDFGFNLGIGYPF